jgi:predicted transcriptional regulator
MSHINVAHHEQYEQQENSNNIVTVKLKHGDWEIEVKCKEDNVKSVIESVLASISEEHKPEFTKHTLQQTLPKHSTCKGLIEELWKEGWFSTERDLNEVYNELSRKGYNYDKTAVSHALNDLLKEGVLTRLGNARRFRYIQKRPN